MLGDMIGWSRGEGEEEKGVMKDGGERKVWLCWFGGDEGSVGQAVGGEMNTFNCLRLCCKR